MSLPGRGVQTPMATWGSIPAVPTEERWDLAFLGILAYLVVEYARPGSMFPELGALHLGKIVTAMTVLGYALHRLGGGRRQRANGIDIGLLVFLFASFVSACFARDQGLAWAGFVDIVRWGVVYFLISRIVNNSWRLRIFVFLLLLLNLKLAQYVIRVYIAERETGLDPMYLAKQGIPAAGGFFANGSDFGLAMCVVLPLAGTLFFGETKKLFKLCLLISFVVFLISIMFCGSRGAVLGVTAVAFTSGVRAPRKLAVVAAVLLLVAAIVFVLPDASKQRMHSAQEWEKDGTASNRIMLWKAGMRMLWDHPIIGVGPWNFARTRMKYYAGGDPNPRATLAHNTFVEAVVDLGLLGGVPFLMLLLLYLRLNAQTRKYLLALGAERRRGFEYCLALGLDLALVGFLTAGFFHSALYYPQLWLLLGLSVGLHSTCTQIQAEKLPIPQDPRRGFALAAS